VVSRRTSEVLACFAGDVPVAAISAQAANRLMLAKPSFFKASLNAGDDFDHAASWEAGLLFQGARHKSSDVKEAIGGCAFHRGQVVPAMTSAQTRRTTSTL